ncbi:MAG: SIMPL domain-containing protein [Candidatus Bathyarchaeota archaeon]|nr:MAG: SIMPL domain-containing protein [Candidatus Bathyarchaeota archaeon]
MDTKRQYISVIAICVSVILAGMIIAYQPQPEEEETFKFPSGIPPSLGSTATVGLGEELVNAILVSGSGSASAQATQATLTLGVWTQAQTASEAAAENAQLMNAVITAIEAHGITEDDMKTVTYSISPEYDWEARSVSGYRVVNMIQVELDDKDLVGGVLDAATAAGANNVQGISFGISEEEAKVLAQEAYVLALGNAQEKANLIAETLGLEITGVLSVSESIYQPYIPLRGFAEATIDVAATTPIIEGALSVSVSVQVAFSFQ